MAFASATWVAEPGVASNTGSCGCVAFFTGHNRHAPRHGAKSQERDHMPGRPPVPVDRVKQLLAEGVKQSAVAERLGVSKTVVNCIAHGKYLEGSK